MSQPNIPIKQALTFYFIGVTTSQSSIMTVFPLWMKELGRPEVVIQGVDFNIHDDPEAYRQIVAQIKHDPLSLGALVTTHKLDLLNAARDMFDYLDPYAKICGEVSSILKHKGKLEGHAIDPIASGLALNAILGKDYFAHTGGDILCFGAGGAATAISLHFINNKIAGDRPKRFIVVDLSQARLNHLHGMVDSQSTAINFEYVLNQDPKRNDDILAVLPAGSVVINATGMGKDRPGSPITDAGRFPFDGIAWELNYRGERDFMHQALAQAESRNLTIEDGWLYFLHGWTQVIAQVLHTPIEGELFARLAKIAAVARK